MSARDRTPPIGEAAAGSSPLTPNPKRAKMGSPEHAVETSEESQSTENAAKIQQKATDGSALIDQPKDTERADTSETTSCLTLAEEDAEEEEEEEEDLEADDGYADSAFGTDNSDFTSIASSIWEGFVENGRRYQTKREGEYWGPSDEKQFEAMQALHILYRILDSKHTNDLFYSPIPNTAQNILDIGTGSGIWAIEVAERYPSALVQGIDLYPPPEHWLPPNCRMEVDDVLKPWEFKENGRFDLVHMRAMLGSFSDEQWRLVYKQAYNNIAPGGWIEQVETGIIIRSDDGTLPANSLLAGWGNVFIKCAAKSGRNIDTADTFRQRIEKAGFTNVHEKTYKVPIGDWAKSALMKEAGKFNKAQILQGMEGYAM